MFISIGNVCVVAHWLRKTQSTETFFFDWLVTSLRSVNEVLSIENEETMRTKLKNVTFEGTLDNNKVVVCKDFDRLKSVHDLPIMNGNIDTHFVDKYVRRHARLIDTIKTIRICILCCLSKLPRQSDENLTTTSKLSTLC